MTAVRTLGLTAVRVLSTEALSGLLSPAQIIVAVEEAARAYAAGIHNVPARQHIEWTAGNLLLMPSVGAQSIGIKLVSVVPSNTSRGLPVTNGLMVLNHRDTGIPVALLNAGSLTMQRTGAVGALGVKYMTPLNLDSLGIIGTGIQGTAQAIFACAVRPIKDIYYVAHSEAGAVRFVKTLATQLPAVRLIRCADASALLQATSLVITATTSHKPVLPDEAELLRDKHFVSVGSFKPTMQELPLSLYRLAGQLAIDSVQIGGHGPL
jgi:ornithine cyclodeaminase/alanine dehydrogenase-like protein (mu-crystallin family)